MVLKRSEKEQLVSDLAATLRGVPAAAIVSFKALTMTESAALRRALRPSGGRVRVVPKRLFRRLMEDLGWPAAFAETSDSLAVAWIEDPAKLHLPAEALAKAGRSGGTDLFAPAKSLHAYVKASEGARLLGGVLHGEMLDAAAVEQLALLPPMDTLRAQLAGVLAGPLRGFAGVLQGVLRGLPGVLQARSRAAA